MTSSPVTKKFHRGTRVAALKNHAWNREHVRTSDAVQMLRWTSGYVRHMVLSLHDAIG